MHIRAHQSARHLELVAESLAAAHPEVFPLFELTADTPSVPQAEAHALLDTLAAFFRETSFRCALIEVISPSRNLWLLEHISIWNYAFEKGLANSTIAYVVDVPRVDRDLIFAENYAHKLGIVLKFFTRKSDALHWLLKRADIHALEPGTNKAGEERPFLLKTRTTGSLPNSRSG